jgi:DNA invertase Pin-like site-specific DNA recombinase
MNQHDQEQEHAIAVARVSQLKQRPEDQRPGLARYAERRGLDLDAVVEVHGRSAFHGRHRKQILKAVAQHVTHGRASVVIFRHVDRMARMEWEDGMRFFLEIRDSGARIEFSEQEFLNGNMELLGLFLRAGHEESKVKQSRKLQGLQSSRQRGELTGKASWGYDAIVLDGVRTMIPNELGRKWIPAIYYAAVEGKSLEVIGEMLIGVPSPQRNGRWNPASIRRVIASNSKRSSPNPAGPTPPQPASAKSARRKRRHSSKPSARQRSQLGKLASWN